MKIGLSEAMWQLRVNEQLVECVDEFCYLGSIITDTGSCKANSAFNRLYMAPETFRTSN